MDKYCAASNRESEREGRAGRGAKAQVHGEESLLIPGGNSKRHARKIKCNTPLSALFL